ncbi:MAG: DNA mismatch repair endonuclease MutL [Bacteroidales bacterium]|nr:DNA mismatch repair endonuclease MutL [Bacteroidales bacterium]
MKIRVLPGNIANMIAAGEVVQRPASVVKELVENAVDAGADRIDVNIVDGGRTLIQVIDNGCGMSQEDAVLCFERHATSKISSAEDLESISTFGFRGEALASIAAIAEVTLRTRRKEDETALEVHFAASQNQGVELTQGPCGSNFMVRNLFYNVPARRKYLKSDLVEFRHIVEEFERVALTRCDIAFSLTHNGKEVFVLKPAPSLKMRIKDLYSSSVASELLDISEQTSVAAFNGFVGRPESARKGQTHQFFFVNGRYFRSPYLGKAVAKAYEGMIPDGMMPSYFIFIDVPPYSVDVNVSPTKTEIKFEEDSIIFSTLFATIKGVLGQQSFGDTLDFGGSRMTEIPISRAYNELHPLRVPDAPLDPDYNPFDTDGFPNEPNPFMSSFAEASYVDKKESYGKLFEDVQLATSSAIVLDDKYILTQRGASLLVVNIRRARLRVLYEKYYAILSRNGHCTQTALFETPVYVGVENALLLEEHLELLNLLGFEIRMFGNDTIVVSGVPEGFSADSGAVEQVVADVIDILKEKMTTLEEAMLSSMSLRFAQSAVSGGQSFQASEASRLVNDLFACSDSEITPQGKKIYVCLTTADLDKRF